MKNIKFVSVGLFTLGSVLLTSCEDNTVIGSDDSFEYANYQSLGDSLSNISQQTLLSNVGREMQAGGPLNAIDFCNLNASVLMDSLSKKFSATISRITDQPRNPDNKAVDDEVLVLNALNEGSLLDTVIESRGEITYYKSIRLGMPTCLKCHGGKNDIDEPTLNLIQTRYPKDQANNYSLGDFRGAWKIQFEE